MTLVCRCTIEGVPAKPWTAPAFSGLKSGKKGYTPGATPQFQQIVRHYLQQAMGTQEPVSGPISLTIVIVRQTSDESLWLTPCFTRGDGGDLTNCVKAIEDAGKAQRVGSRWSGVYRDDCQTALISACALWGDIDRIEIEVSTIDVGHGLFTKSARASGGRTGKEIAR